MVERLTDIRDELDRQLSRLERQAKAAEKYTQYKKDERLLSMQLMGLQYQAFDRQAQAQQQNIQQKELSIEAQVTQRVNLDTAIEKNRSELIEKNDIW